jgi:EmrB/QacA subfamily drug resistance transporter
MATHTARSAEELGWPTWRLALVIVFGAFTSGLDASLTAIGLDAIGADLGSELGLTQWVASSYLLALAVSLPVAGWLGRRIGVGRLWLTALTVFVAASGLCAAAPDIGSLLVLRVLQGLAGGLLIPAGQTVLGQAVGSHRLGRVMATLGIAVSLAPALGPVVGGLVLDSASWRWLFAINVPIGVLGIALGWRYVPHGRPGPAPRLDRLGLLLVSTGLPLLVLGLTTGSERRTLLAVDALGPLLLGAAALVWFVVHARRRREPLVDLGLFRDPVFAAATATGAFGGMLLFGTALLFPLYFQLAGGDDVVTTGLRLLGLGLGTAVALPFVGRGVDRLGGGVVATAGAAACVVATVPFAVLPPGTDPVLVQALLAFLGAAMAFAVVPSGIAAYKTVAPPQLGDATTIVNIVQRVGGALGSALFAVIVAGGLADGPHEAFRPAFWAVVAAAVLTLAAAVRLLTAQRAGSRRGRPVTPSR